MRAKTAFFLPFVCLAAACGPSVRPESDPEACAEELGPAALPDVCGEDCVDLSRDTRNCGFCGNVCGTGTNACVDGQCLCANDARTVVSKDPCDFPAVCDQTGWCLTPDPAGAECNEIEGIYCKFPDGRPDPSRACVEGFCTVPNCDHEEVCNVYDDCDGLADQLEPGQWITEACYTGDPSELNVGICHSGSRRCVAGGWTPCQNEQTPVGEEGFLRCDGLDNDCDACPDNVSEDGECQPLPPLKADIVFIIDRSGSMGEVIEAVVVAVQQWSGSIGTNGNIRFALVDPTAGDQDGVAVTRTLVGYAEFAVAIAAVSADGGDREPMHYAAERVLTDSLEMPIGFAPDSLRFVIAIHDESALDPFNVEPDYDETSACGAVPANTVLAVITLPDWFPEWDACTSAGGMTPTAIALSSDAATMLAHLNQIIETPCL